MNSPRTILAGAGVALAVLAAAAPASAHSGGRVQLFVDRLGLHSTGGNDWTVSVIMVDADSGSPQPGFDVVVPRHGPFGRQVLQRNGRHAQSCGERTDRQSPF